MIGLSTLSTKSKIGIGVLLSYTSLEVYMHLRTKYAIYKRRSECSLMDKIDDLDISRFKSITVAGLFVNPFEEYRPQTAFEFVVVRLLELVESFYGPAVELHKGATTPSGSVADVHEFLKSKIPAAEIMKTNAMVLSECINKQDFALLNKMHGRIEGNPSLNIALKDQLLFTWLGQSCSLLQVSGINILTDPILSDHLVSEYVGPRRFVKSPMKLEDIKRATNDQIDFVLVSHDHPDHLEMNLVKEIGNSTTWVVPLGLKKKLARKGVYRVIEMDWWDSIPLNQFIPGSPNLPDTYEVVCVPSMHWSGRYVLDSNTSLWCSFIIRRNGESIIYHAGDTGYSRELFKTIGNKFGPVALSLLPIGQYCPSWHQKPRHISPEEAVDICSLISSKFMMGVHWGTFKLSSEPILEPKFLLEEVTAKQGNFDRFQAPNLGLTYMYDLENSTKSEIIQPPVQED